MFSVNTMIMGLINECTQHLPGYSTNFNSFAIDWNGIENVTKHLIEYPPKKFLPDEHCLAFLLLHIFRRFAILNSITCANQPFCELLELWPEHLRVQISVYHMYIHIGWHTHKSPFFIANATQKCNIPNYCSGWIECFQQGADTSRRYNLRSFNQPLMPLIKKLALCIRRKQLKRQ